jgi:general secretion pathway protein L
MMAASLPTHRTDPRAGQIVLMRRFFAWWSGELADLASARASGARDWRVMLLRSERGCDVYTRTRGRVELVGTSSAEGVPPLAELLGRLGRQRIPAGQIVLRLGPDEVVQRRLSVPAAAGEVLEAVVRNQIERLAPWPADKAFFAYETSAASEGSATLDVRLAVTARSLVEGLVADLEALGFAPGVVDYGEDAATEPRLNLLAAGSGESRRSGRLLLSVVGLICLTALVAGAIGVAGLVQQTRELDALAAQLQELQVKSAAALPGQASARRLAWLAGERGGQPSMAIALEALSRALPDDAWLTRMEVEQGTVRLAGNAANAAALIGRIEASGHFADVQFSAPTTLAEGEGESFTITARVVPGRRLD